MADPKETKDEELDKEAEDSMNNVCICIECGLPFSRLDTAVLCELCIIKFYKTG